MVDPVHGWEAMVVFSEAQAAVHSFTSATLERLERAIDLDVEREDVINKVCVLLRLGLRKGWADFTHVALFCAAFENPANGVGLLSVDDGDEVHVVDGWSKCVVMRVVEAPSDATIFFGSSGADNGWSLMDKTDSVRRYLVGKSVFAFGGPSVGDDDLMNILWVEGNPLQLLLDALRTNLGIIEEVARVLPVQLVPELVAEFHLCSGLDAIKPRFTAPKRKRLADTPLGRAFAKASNVQTTSGPPGRKLDPRDGHGS